MGDRGFLGPAAVGVLVDGTGWNFMPIDAALFAVLALAAVLRIEFLRRHDELAIAL